MEFEDLKQLALRFRHETNRTFMDLIYEQLEPLELSLHEKITVINVYYFTPLTPLIQ